MKKNVGLVDKLLRFLFAALVLILFLTDTITGVLAIMLGIVSVVLVLTGAIGWCGIYALFGISTRKHDST